MNDRVFLNKIHKVTFGPNPGSRESVGHTVGHPISAKHPHLLVSSIVLDDYLYSKYGKISCVIYVKDTRKEYVASNIEVIYKAYVDVPITIFRDIEQ